MPDTRYELIDGKVEYVPPSLEPHGSLHSKLSALLEAHAAAEWNVASDMLTRTSEKGDMAPDASIYPIARDPETGGRQLEELAFEVVSTERLAHTAKKARALSARGVRRVFAIDVERRRALEWSMEAGVWEILPEGASIEDRTLAAPLPLRALIEAGKADDAIARALLVKRNPVIEGALADAEQRGEQRGAHIGKVAALLAILSARGVRVPQKAEARIRDEADAATVDRWITRAATCADIDELFTG